MRNKNIENIFKECSDLCNSKNEDYANSTDFYANFRTVEDLGIPVWVGVYVRFLDKVKRMSGFICRFNNTGKLSVNHESIEDTLKDGINYLAICLDSYRQWQKQQDHQKEVIKAESACVTDNNDVDANTVQQFYRQPEKNVCE
jgi:hypothetical protein